MIFQPLMFKQIIDYVSPNNISEHLSHPFVGFVLFYMCIKIILTFYQTQYSMESMDSIKKKVTINLNKDEKKCVSDILNKNIKKEENKKVEEKTDELAVSKKVKTKKDAKFGKLMALIKNRSNCPVVEHNFYYPFTYFKDGITRNIAVYFAYNYKTHKLMYGASVFKPDKKEPIFTSKNKKNCRNTAMNRMLYTPVIIKVNTIANVDNHTKGKNNKKPLVSDLQFEDLHTIVINNIHINNGQQFNVRNAKNRKIVKEYIEKNIPVYRLLE